MDELEDKEDFEEYEKRQKNEEATKLLKKKKLDHEYYDGDLSHDEEFEREEGY